MPKVNFYSVAYNRPDFIPIQYNSLQYNLRGRDNFNFSFTVMINSKDLKMKSKLVAVCEKHTIPYIEVPISENELYNGGLTAYNYIRDHFFMNAKPNEYSVIMDSDMFFYAPLDIPELISGYDVAAIYHQREKKIFGFKVYNYEYLWVGFMIFNHGRFDYSHINFNPLKNICDVGGMTTYFLKEQVQLGLNVKWLNHTPDITKEYKAIFPEELWEYYKIEMGFQLIENSVIHYYRGSNWDGNKEELLIAKDNFLKEFIDLTKMKKLILTQSDYYDPMAYSRKNFNGLVNNNHYKVKPSIGDYASQSENGTKRKALI